MHDNIKDIPTTPYHPSTFLWSSSGDKKYVVEGRDKEGNLDFTVKLPFTEATCKQLFDYYFKFNNVDSASQEEIAAWYNNQGIYFRPKTW